MLSHGRVVLQSSQALVGTNTLVRQDVRMPNKPSHLYSVRFQVLFRFLDGTECGGSISPVNAWLIPKGWSNTAGRLWMDIADPAAGCLMNGVPGFHFVGSLQPGVVVPAGTVDEADCSPLFTGGKDTWSTEVAVAVQLPPWADTAGGEKRPFQAWVVVEAEWGPVADGEPCLHPSLCLPASVHQCNRNIYFVVPKDCVLASVQLQWCVLPGLEDAYRDPGTLFVNMTVKLSPDRVVVAAANVQGDALFYVDTPAHGGQFVFVDLRVVNREDQGGMSPDVILNFQ